MAGTRSRSSQQNSSPPVSEKQAGTKRKADEPTSPQSTKKSGRPAKEQKTLEQTLGKDEPQDESFDEELGDREKAEESLPKDNDIQKEMNGSERQTNTPKKGQEKNAFDQVKADERDDGKTSKTEEGTEAATGNAEGTAVEEDKQRAKAQPSNIMEKGIIYFFTRGRVGINDPNSPQDLQRSFFVLRPLPPGAKLTDGAIQDVGNNRLIALPKKVWPKSGKDKFMCFVEKGKTTMADLKETFFQGSEYSTKTVGTRQTPEVTPVGEGVYAMTSTGEGRTTTHLAYMLTIPTEIGEVQKDIGLAEKGSFVLSMKNPESGGPSYAQLPSTPDWPKEIQDEFGSLGWLPAKPHHLDYASASMLLIGEGFDGAALEPTAQDDKNDDKEDPKEELEKLEGEDEQRIDNLKGKSRAA